MRLAVILFSLLAIPMAASAEKRLGLVIGNDAYGAVPELEKAVSDATAISAALSDQGFEIMTALDTTRREMNQRISEFTHRLEPGDTALVFYAGHGVEIDGENYLLPTDILAPASGERDFIKSESIALSELLDRIRATGAGITIAIIDACRNNPFETTTGRSIGSTRGLGRITAPQGTFVIFSAGAGQLALDRLNEADTARNSVFTRMLLPRLSEPGLELRALVSGLRRDVRDLARTVNHDQFPAYYDELLGQFYFSSASEPQPVPAPALADGQSASRSDFELARSLNTRAAYDAFIARHRGRGDDFTVQMAIQMRDQLNAETRNTRAPDSNGASGGIAERDIIRQTQAGLNAIGCQAGGADGVAGRRTRAAFERFIRESGAKLPPDALGTQAALDAVRAQTGTVCVAATPAPASGDAYSLAGTWHFTATCALLVKVKGTVRYRHLGGNRYQGSLTDSLGQKANIDANLNGRDYSATEYFPGITNKAWGRLAADGKSMTGGASNTCTFYSSKG